MITGFYMDESGNTGFGDIPQQPVLCYGGILVPNALLTQLEQDFKTISYSIKLAIQAEIKGLSEDQLEEMPFFRTYEMHGKPFVDGDKLYSKISEASRLSYLEEMLKLLITHDIKVIASITKKELYKANTGEKHHINMHTLGLTNLIHTIEGELMTLKKPGVITCDNGRPAEIELLLRTIRQESKSGFIFTDLAVKDSHNCQLVQLADIIVFLTTIYYRTQYGYVRKHLNRELVELYTKYLAPRVKVWEYV